MILSRSAVCRGAGAEATKHPSCRQIDSIGYMQKREPLGPLKPKTVDGSAECVWRGRRKSQKRRKEMEVLFVICGHHRMMCGKWSECVCVLLNRRKKKVLALPVNNLEVRSIKDDIFKKKSHNWLRLPICL